MKKMIYGLCALSFVSLVAFQARSQSTVNTTEKTTVTTFTPDERRVIREKVTVHKETLAPDLQQKIVVGQPLPVVVYEKSQPISSDVLVALPKQPESTKLVIVGDRVVRISEPSHTVQDVFDLDDLPDKVQDIKKDQPVQIQ